MVSTRRPSTRIDPNRRPSTRRVSTRRPSTLQLEALLQDGLHQEALHQDRPQPEDLHQIQVQPAATALPGAVEIKEDPDMTNDEGEEPVQEPREKSFCRRFLDWLSVEEEKEPNQERNTRTSLKVVSSSESFRITLANCAIQRILFRHSGLGVWHMLLHSFKSSHVSMLCCRSV